MVRRHPPPDVRTCRSGLREGVERFENVGLHRRRVTTATVFTVGDVALLCHAAVTESHQKERRQGRGRHCRRRSWYRARKWPGCWTRRVGGAGGNSGPKYCHHGADVGRAEGCWGGAPFHQRNGPLLLADKLVVVAPLTVVVEACREAREVAADADRWAADAGASAVRAGGSRGERCFLQVAADEAHWHDGGCQVVTATLPDSHGHGANERGDEHGEEERARRVVTP